MGYEARLQTNGVVRKQSSQSKRSNILTRHSPRRGARLQYLPLPTTYFDRAPARTHPHVNMDFHDRGLARHLKRDAGGARVRESSTSP